MFNELGKIFGSQQKERRHSPRKKVRFGVSWIRKNGPPVQGIGMEMSLNGCLVALKENPPDVDFDVILDIGRPLKMRLHTARKGTVTRDGAMWYVVGASFQSVAVDDYDTLVRFMKGLPLDVGNLAQADLAKMDRNDDAYRLLPLVVQQRVLGALARLGRVEIPPEGQQPLLRMEEIGSGGGVRRLSVHSRVITRDGPVSYDTVLAVDAAGAVKVES